MRPLANHHDEVKKGQLSSLKPMLRYLKPYRRMIAIALIALLCSSSAVLSMGQGLKLLVDRGIGRGDAAMLDDALLVLLTIVVVLAGATFARFFYITKVGECVVADIRRDIYQHLVHLSPAFYESTRVGEVISRLTADTTVLQVVVGSTLSVAARNIVLLIGGLTMLVLSSAKLAGYIALMVPLVVLPILVLGKKVRLLSRASQQKVAEISSHAEETLHAVRTVQSYTRETHEITHFDGRVNEALSTAITRVRMRSLMTSLVIMLVFGSVGVLLWVGGHDVVKGVLTPGQLSSFIFYSIVVAGAFGALSEVVGDVQRAAGAAEDLMALKQVQTTVHEPADPVALAAGSNDVRFDHVTFHYPSRPDTAALSDITFTVKAGETLALVGPSGAGKSTVLQLLLRFYDPQSGTVMLGKTDIRQAGLKDLRSRFAYVAQESVIFSATAAENIAYGDPTASREAIEKAAEAARATDFIRAMPQGFDTYLGERGVRISGGEKQRVAIARAILKNPDILLLDEATSALDSENERLVQEAIETLQRARTTIVIAHRLSTVQSADRIVLLDGGRIAAIGTHKELLAENTLYQKLARNQFAA